MESWNESVRYLDTNAGARVLTVRQRCLQSLIRVAGAWNLAGAALLGYALFCDAPIDPRLRIIVIVALMISAAIYSVALPLHFILREDKNPG